MLPRIGGGGGEGVSNLRSSAKIVKSPAVPVAPVLAGVVSAFAPTPGPGAMRAGGAEPVPAVAGAAGLAANRPALRVPVAAAARCGGRTPAWLWWDGGGRCAGGPQGRGGGHFGAAAACVDEGDVGTGGAGGGGSWAATVAASCGACGLCVNAAIGTRSGGPDESGVAGTSSSARARSAGGMSPAKGLLATYAVHLGSSLLPALPPAPGWAGAAVAEGPSSPGRQSKAV